MAHFVVLASFTDKGIAAIKDTAKRAKSFRELASTFGVKISTIYWTMGRYDVVLTLEASSDESVAALLMKAGSLGNLKSETLRAFSESEISSLVSKL
ncbi:MAG: GYD family protein [Omnitrophica bacterium RIFCSPHIGHO2_02_FULL_49_9]|nr:MAG: GYD family protein [Omnitrophica bacterium RIFCSPHIGHO2_02_FULL_49_9]OGW89420.1 MAG: GYD family protein [Omnitrophica bacterium RIFCSPLOWO2_01_FULL_50_24]